MIPIFYGVFSACPIAHEVEGVRLWSSPESTRFVIDLAAPTEHRVFSLENPSRVVIDLADTVIPEASLLPEKQGFVSGIRTGKQPGGQLRVVLDVSQSVKPQSFLLEPNQKGDIIWKFDNAANIEVACNVPGHYQAGMTAEVNIK